MRWTRPRGGRPLRLAYCLNLHPADDLAGVLAGLRDVTLPLRDRVAPGARFGVGMYLGADLARRLASSAGADDRARLRDFLAEHDLDPFTFNAFPFGGFHEAGLKERVFRPAWDEPERLAFTLDVARVAASLDSRAEFLSVSTHTGFFGTAAGAGGEARGARAHRTAAAAGTPGPGGAGGDGAFAAREAACARGLVAAARGLARIEEETGRRVVLALEPEPGANCGRTADLARLRAALLAASRASGVHGGGGAAACGRAPGGEGAATTSSARRARAAAHAAGDDAAGADVAAVARHVGTCLDACHAAVEHEQPVEALAAARAGGAPLGKLQFTSALALTDPRDDGARVRLLSMAEPRYLHQVRAVADGERLAVSDLPDLERALADPASPWWRAPEWRCHFHVPVDLSAVGETAALATTRATADALLDALLAESARPATDPPELHVEIETYTWDVLPGPPRSPADLVAGLEREYAHVTTRLRHAGWTPSTDPPRIHPAHV